MEIVFSPTAKKDLLYWSESGNRGVQRKLDALFISLIESPFAGIGKPEQLKHKLSGFWSRRIDKEHRLVYEVLDDVIYIHSLKGHY
jgi:toxin YoeB